MKWANKNTIFSYWPDTQLSVKSLPLFTVFAHLGEVGHFSLCTWNLERLSTLPEKPPWATDGRTRISVLHRCCILERVALDTYKVPSHIQTGRDEEGMELLPDFLPFRLHVQASCAAVTVFSPGLSLKTISWLRAASPFLPEILPFVSSGQLLKLGLQPHMSGLLSSHLTPMCVILLWDLMTRVSMSSKLKACEIFGGWSFMSRVCLSKVLTWGFRVSEFETFLHPWTFPQTCQSQSVPQSPGCGLPSRAEAWLQLSSNQGTQSSSALLK